MVGGTEGARKEGTPSGAGCDGAARQCRCGLDHQRLGPKTQVEEEER
jgi:hypothetical protein